MNKVLVLGSEGVIGKALVSLLTLRGYSVTRWDITLNKDHDLRTFEPPTEEYDFIYFLAYDIGGSKYLGTQKLDFINNNVMIMYNTFKSLEKSKKPFIFASSQMQNMDCAYGTLKKLGEHYTENLGAISVRFWNVYGPEEHGTKSHVITDFIHQYKNKGLIELMTNGQEQRQFLHTNDCAEALLVVTENYETFCSVKSVVDITNFEWTKIIDLAKLVVDHEKDVESLVIPGTVSDSIQTKHNEPTRSLLNDLWAPKISLKDGIMLCAENI
jgi:nucleoside-diphosphate-sugar epimerase